MKINLIELLCRPHCEWVCDPDSERPRDLSLLIFTTQIAAAMPLKKVYEIFALLHPIHTIIRQHGSTALSDLKTSFQCQNLPADENNEDTVNGTPANHNGTSKSNLGKSLENTVDPCIGIISLLMLSNHLMGSYAMKADRLASFEASAERRKAEENKDLQVSCVWPLYTYLSICQ